MTKPFLMLNEDCNHFSYTRSPEEMTAEGVDALVDRYAQGQVTDLLFNISGMRSSVPSAVKQVFWEGFDPDADDEQPFFAGTPAYERPMIRKWVGNMLLLHQRSIDPYQRWLARSRQLGVRGWISIRMNDIHSVDAPGHMMHDRLWQQHPEYWRETGREFESPIDRAWDYGHAEVREHMLAYIAEIVERYDMDGLELDFMRQPYNLRAGYEEEGASLMTALLRDVRKLTSAKVAARVPSWPETSRRLGLDAVAWAREGLVDHLIPSSIFDSTECDMPVELWQQLLLDTGVTLLPGLEFRLLPFPQATPRNQTVETIRGQAMSFLDRGADGIYLFNFMDRSGGVYLDDELLDAGLQVTAPAADLRRHVLTFSDCFAPGEPRRVMLPQPIQRYGFRPSTEFRLPTGPAPLSGQTVEIHLGLEAADQPPVFGRFAVYLGHVMHIGKEPVPEELARRLLVRVNGHLCPFARTLGEPTADTGATHAYAVPAGVLRRGDNVIEIGNPTESNMQAVWVEVTIG